VNSVFLVWWRQVEKTSILKSLFEFWYLPIEETFYINFDEIALSGKVFFWYAKWFYNFYWKKLIELILIVLIGFCLMK